MDKSFFPHISKVQEIPVLLSVVYFDQHTSALHAVLLSIGKSEKISKAVHELERKDVHEIEH